MRETANKQTGKKKRKKIRKKYRNIGILKEKEKCMKEKAIGKLTKKRQAICRKREG